MPWITKKPTNCGKVLSNFFVSFLITALHNTSSPVSLRKDTGELVLCNAVIKKETKKFDKTFPQLVGFLVIHGMLHLKGMRHSSTMERAEKKYCKKYGKKYFSRNRRGLRNDESRSGRVRKRRKKS